LAGRWTLARGRWSLLARDAATLDPMRTLGRAIGKGKPTGREIFNKSLRRRHKCNLPPNDVRFTPESGHVLCNSVCPLSANSGHNGTSDQATSIG
jgi:hypothetical protein